MGDDSAARSTAHWPLALVAVPVVLVLYVLSIGPVAWIAEQSGMNAQVLPIARIVYAPVILLYEYTALKGPIDWYMSLWGVR